MANRITTIFDADVGNLKKGLKETSAAMAEAHGFTDTLKAGVSGVVKSFSGFLTTPAGIAATGTAVAAAGVAAFEAVSKWSALGVEIGKFADATGTTNEEASRLIEHAGDIGISADSLESSLGKMNKAAGNTPKLFKDAGIEIAHTKDGAVDANQTFLNVVDRLNMIQDPAKKAALAAKLLGKGWQDMSELIGEGSTKLKKSLADVEGQKVFDDEKVAKAREFRKTMDELHDSLQDLALTAGKDLLPALEEIVTDLVKVIHAAEDVGNALGHVSDAMSVDVFSTDPVQKMIDKINQMKETTIANVGDMDAAHHKLADGAMAGLINAEEEATTAMDEMKRHSQMTTDSIKRGLDEDKSAMDNLKGSVSDDTAWTDLQLEFIDVQKAGTDAMLAVGEGGDDARQKTLEYTKALDDLKSHVIDYAAEVLKLPTEQVTKIVAAVDPQSLDEAEALLAALTRNRTMNVSIVAKGGAGFNDNGTPHFAQGGTVPGGRGQPSLAVVHGGETITQPGMAAGGNGITVNLTVNAGLGTDGRDVGLQIVDILKKTQRQFGATAP